MAELSPLQVRVLEILAGVEPPWTLTGGAALTGVHLGHRMTRDLDLFWHGRRELGEVADATVSALVAAGLQVSPIERSPGFVRLLVTRAPETTVVDLVAEPVPVAEPPMSVQLGSVTILVDTPHEILVNKLGALLSRSELRDLQDVEALLRTGGDLPRALADAARKDGGMSGATLAWVLEQMPIAALGAALSLPAPDVDACHRFRKELVERLVTLSRPPS